MNTKESKLVALTFDDGPNTTTTMQVLDKLEKYQVTATFFLIGDCITQASAGVSRQACEMGCEIANHSKTHPDMSRLSAEEIKGEIAYTTEKIREITGKEPAFFRPPYIALSKRLFDTVELPFICGHGAEDWEDSVSAQERARRILEETRDGSIILLHDMEGNFRTVEALDQIIPTLLERGYTFVTVSQLFEQKQIVPRTDIARIYTNVYDETIYQEQEK